MTIKVGYTPQAGAAALQLGLNKGFFEEEDLDVELAPTESTAATTAAVVAGESQIGLSSVDGNVLARGNGLPVKTIAPAVAQPKPESLTSADDTNAVIVGKDSPIKTPADLEGKTIAVNQARGQLELTTRETARLNGVDDSKFRFRVLPLPEALQAVMEGKVDAAAQVEPFISVGHSQGARTVMNIYPLDPAGFDEWLTGVWYTTESYLEEHPDVVERFRRAILKANRYANEHPDEAREAITQLTDLPPEQAANIVLFRFPEELDTAVIDRVAELNHEYGYAKQKANVDELVAE